MPKSQEHSVEVKAIYFWVIDFIKREQNGPMIPLKPTTTRILTVLSIFEKLLFNLSAEIKQVQEEQKKKDEIKVIEPNRLRSRAVSDTSISSTLSATVHYCRKHQLSTTYISQINFVSVHSPVSPKEIASCSRPQIHILEEADEIRFIFHLLLSQNLYPTTQRLLGHITGLHPNFPVTSTKSL